MPFDVNHSDDAQQPLDSQPIAAAPSACAPELSELERSLPDDLQLLAVQLSEDALHLSALYPPRAPEPWIRQTKHILVDNHARQVAKASRHALPWKKVLGGLAAASVLLAAALSWQGTRMNSAPGPALVPPSGAPEVTFAKRSFQQTAADEAKKSASKELTAYQPVAIPADAPGRVMGTPATEPTILPAGLFLTLSGPEQEAMLDLIEDAKLEQPSVSF